GALSAGSACRAGDCHQREVRRGAWRAGGVVGIYVVQCAAVIHQVAYRIRRAGDELLYSVNARAGSAGGTGGTRRTYGSGRAGGTSRAGSAGSARGPCGAANAADMAAAASAV